VSRWSRGISLLAGLTTIGIALAYVAAYYVLLPEGERARVTTAARLTFGVVVIAGVGATAILGALWSKGPVRAGVLTGCAVIMLMAGVIGAGRYDPLALGLWFVGFPALLAAGLAGAEARPHRAAAVWMLIGAVLAGAAPLGSFWSC